MFGQNFYYSCIRNYTVAFGSLFNDVLINRYDSNGHISQVLKIPLTYAAKDKMFALATGNPGAGQTDGTQKQVSIQLPIISFFMPSMTYNNGRKLNTLNQRWRRDDDNPDAFKMQYMSIPMDLHFELSIMAKVVEDGAKIVEQIVPYFKPQWDMTVQVVPEMGINLDVPIVWNGTFTQTDNFDTAFTQRQAVVWTTNFTMKAHLFGPIKEKPIIKFPQAEFNFSEDLSDFAGAYVVYPGLTANGEPTSNSALSIDPHEIYVDDNWGVVETANGIIRE